jgi:uncharacterized protein with PIN domain
MQDFDSRLNRISESVLSEALGEFGSLPRWLRIDAADCYKEPQEFDDALVDAFQQMGALLIETKILTRFYRSIGARYSRSDDLNFAEEIRNARIDFERLRRIEESSRCY